ncbi:hypothetical protein A4X09_0g6099 [Tilletia walkeri]|uniref:Uncharacterized protein n=1 Tax=Tilletia walkeri TaxID=117179 RepID=A0A8X7N3C0_9BASI|nr:hypothetical protein A4X09_0g6099 [Tilletia walkeri]
MFVFVHNPWLRVSVIRAFVRLPASARPAPALRLSGRRSPSPSHRERLPYTFPTKALILHLTSPVVTLPPHQKTTNPQRRAMIKSRIADLSYTSEWQAVLVLQVGQGESRSCAALPGQHNARRVSLLVSIDKKVVLNKACLLGCGVTTGFGAATVTNKVDDGTLALARRFID